MTKVDKKIEDWETVKVKCTAVELNIPGVIFSYHVEQLMPTPGVPGQASMQKIQRGFQVPRIQLKFKAQVDQPLQVNGVYSDGINTFKAVEEYVIINEKSEVDSFRIPTELKLVNFAVLKRLNTKP